MDIYKKEISDIFTKQAQLIPYRKKLALKFTEMFSIKKRNVQKIWKVSLIHSQYLGDKSGRPLTIWADKGDRTAFTRFISGYINCFKFEQHRKVFPSYNKCFSNTASPAHLLICVGFSKEDFLRDSILFEGIFLR